MDGVWHACGNRATAGGVTLAADRGHRFRRAVAPPVSVRGAIPVCERGWWVAQFGVSVGLAGGGSEGVCTLSK